MCALHKAGFPLFFIPSSLKFLFLFLVLGFGPHIAGAEPRAGDPLEETLTQLGSIELRLKKIEENQKEMLARQEKILAEIDRLRIWTRRT